MGHMRGWGLLLAICLPLLVLFSWSRLGAQSSRINIARYTEWAAEHPGLLTRPLDQFYVKNRRLAGPNDVALPPVPGTSGVKTWSLQPDGVLRVELDAKEDGHPLVLKYVPIVRNAGGVFFDCVSNALPLHVSRFCRTEVLGSEADVPAQVAANARALQELAPMVSGAGMEIAAGAAGSVVAVPGNVASLEQCGYQCVKLQSCVTPRPLACGRQISEANTTRFEVTATAGEFRGSGFASLAEADQACEQAAGAGARVLRASSISGLFKLNGGNEYWIYDELRPANNCWAAPR